MNIAASFVPKGACRRPRTRPASNRSVGRLRAWRTGTNPVPVRDQHSSGCGAPTHPSWRRTTDRAVPATRRTTMDPAYQLLGAAAIGVGLAGTWLAARNRVGWLVCVLSSVMWLPALTTGTQWVAVGNCGLSVAICVRNFRAQAARARSSADLPAEVAPSREPATV